MMTRQVPLRLIKRLTRECVTCCLDSATLDLIPVVLPRCFSRFLSLSLSFSLSVLCSTFPLSLWSQFFTGLLLLSPCLSTGQVPNQSDDTLLSPSRISRPRGEKTKNKRTKKSAARPFL
ncbi:hypothetical protein LY76DRAFT_347856 [Colletotrichum caudatum]|nr:hypothetical protein LY76DRAFT_347856 [Colletotrichum caudatum]